MVTINSHFDGSSDIETEPVGQNNFSDLEWSGYLPFYAVYDASDSRFFNVNASFSGSGWTVAFMAFHALGGSKAIISDGATDTNIGVMALGENSKIILNGTQVDHIEGWGGIHDVTLGAQHTNSITLGGTQVTLNVGTGGADHIGLNGDTAVTTRGWVGQLELNGGVHELNVGTGGAGRINVNGDVTITTNGNVESIRVHGGDHIFKVESDTIGFLQLGGNNNTVILKDGADISNARTYTETGLSKFNIKDGGDMRVLTANGGDVEINMEGSGRIRTIEAFEGTLDMTTDARFIFSLLAYDSVSEIHIGTGGIGAMQIGSSSGMSHVITAQGDIGSLDILEEDAVKLTLGSGYSGTLRTGNGNDKVIGGSGDIEFLNTRDGADVIVTGSGYVETIRTGEGRDKVTLNGDAGSIHLGVGNDKFFGGAGDDWVIGGSGNDLMKGGGGDDIFFFAEDSGNDRLKAFKQGDDLMLIGDHEGGFETLSIDKVGRHKVIEHDGGTIKLLGLGKADIDIDDFSFV